MSRGFVKEGDQEEIPIVPPRAYLPVGTVNYVTHKGLELLKLERESLISEISTLQIADKDKNRVQINYINAKINLLDERINSAKVIDIANQSKNVVCFGSTITLNENGKKSLYQIVGVDESDLKQNKISFLSPMAKVLINKKIGDKIVLKTPKGNRTITIIKIE